MAKDHFIEKKLYGTEWPNVPLNPHSFIRTHLINVIAVDDGVELRVEVIE